jgi:hypothetical protein
MDGSVKVKMSTGPNDGSGNNEDSTDAPVEIVEVFRMSGGGRGAGSEWAKAKFRSNYRRLLCGCIETNSYSRHSRSLP